MIVTIKKIILWMNNTPHTNIEFVVVKFKDNRLIIIGV